MATTIISDPEPIREDVTLQEVMDRVHEFHKEAQGDLDKTDNAEAAEYYQGLVDAYADLKTFLTKGD